MSMDVSSLGLPKAVIGPAPKTEQNYSKVDPDQVRAKLKDAVQNGEVKDLLAASGKDSASVRSLAEASGGKVRIVSNYSSDVFFNREMPDQIDQDGGYTIGGVKFTESELKQARSVLQAAAGSISAGPGKNTNLDYRNYAQMAIASNAVGVYANSHLNADQQRVVSNAMQEYNDGLVDMQHVLLGSAEGSGYYGRTHVITEDEAKMMNAFKADLTKLTGQTFRKTVAGEAAGTDQIATDKGLIQKIQTLFAGSDLSSQSSRNSILNTYAQLIRPAYLAQGISPADIGRVSANDVRSLSAMFDTILAGASHTPFNLSV